MAAVAGHTPFDALIDVSQLIGTVLDRGAGTRNERHGRRSRIGRRVALRRGRRPRVSCASDSALGGGTLGGRHLVSFWT